MLFKDLLPLHKRERLVVKRKKTFETHLLTSDENQEIICKSDVDVWQKEKLAEAKAEAYKRFLQQEKEKTKKWQKRRKQL